MYRTHFYYYRNSRFTSCLSEHVQIQFLNLLISLHKSIPKEALKNFVEQLQSETSGNNWTNFLLRKLTALVTGDTSTTLPAPTIDRISSTFNPHIDEPLESVTETVHCRKRKMDLETAGHDDTMGMDDIRQKSECTAHSCIQKIIVYLNSKACKTRRIPIK